MDSDGSIEDDSEMWWRCVKCLVNVLEGKGRGYICLEPQHKHWIMCVQCAYPRYSYS